MSEKDPIIPEVLGGDAGIPALGPGLDRATRDEIDIQVATAKRWPRDLARFKANIEALATMDEEVAASCFYKLTRKGENGKPIEGESIRLAEIAVQAWGNCRVYTRSAGETPDGRMVRAQGFFWDLESNSASACEVHRRITKADGKRYGDDMVTVTMLAADSYAYRNAVLRVLRPFLRSAYLKAKAVALGKTKSLAERRKEVLARLCALSAEITLPRILAALGKPNVEVVDWDDVETLIGLGTAIKDGLQTVEEAFPSSSPPVSVSDIAPAAEKSSAVAQPSSVAQPAKGAATAAAVDAPSAEGKRLAPGVVKTLRLVAEKAGVAWEDVEAEFKGPIETVEGDPAKLAEDVREAIEDLRKK